MLVSTCGDNGNGVLAACVPNYIPFLDNPPVQSVGNSGWQVSDVWRDIRVDDFCS
ncbi:hypothetical protein [Nostoc sp.]|uniref:hypothetical protein n=1 Tax=Nostoc sp. TaxID=1180 RepID=UPI003FA546B5